MRQMPTSARVVVGLALAPSGAIIGVAAFFWLLFGWSMATIGLWVAIIAYPSEIVIALPGHFIFTSRGGANASAYALLGALTGCAPFALAIAGGLRQQPMPLFAVIGAVAGVACGLIFWFVACQSD